MKGWTIISLVNSGGLEGKLVLFSCGLKELSLIKAVKLSHVMLKLEEPARPSRIRTEIESKQNGSNQHEDKNINLRGRASFPGNISIKIDRRIFFFPFGKSKNPKAVTQKK